MMMPLLPVDRAWVSRYKWFSKPLQNQPESNHALRHYAFDKLMTVATLEFGLVILCICLQCNKYS